VAARWGLHDPSYFGKLFKAEYGVSPQEFREQHVE
jgi:AraC-like DNA-binding protein